MESIAEKLIELRLSTRKACRKKDGASVKSVLTLCDKALFLLLKKPLEPQELTEALFISKANLTHLMSKMSENGLVEKVACTGDARCVKYSITQKGTNEIRGTLAYLDDKFRMILTKESDYVRALLSIDEVLNLLSFL